MDQLQVPPNSLDAERAVLGSMLIDKDAVERALEIVAETDFYGDAHRIVFRAMADLHQACKPVDLLIVAEELRTRSQLGDVGGVQALSDFIHKVATAAHLEHYARIVHEKAVLRELIAAATRVVQECFSEKEAAVVLDDAQNQIIAVAQRQTSNKFTDAPSMMGKAVEAIEKLHARKSDIIGLATGFTKLDRMPAGLHPGNLILLAGRPGHGKTSLAMNIASNVLLRKTTGAVVFFSMEMSEAEIANRLLSCQSGISLQDVRRGFLVHDNWTRLTNAAARLSETQLFVDDTAGLSVLQVRGRARRLANELRQKGKALSLIIIDYLQLMHGGSRRAENRQLEVAEISRGLKFLARDLKVPVVALSQLSRKVEDKARTDGKPQLSDLRDSGSLEQDADVVVFIHREFASRPQDPTLDPRKAEIILAKQRQGAIGAIPVFFDPELTRFGNLDPAGEEPPEYEQPNLS